MRSWVLFGVFLTVADAAEARIHMPPSSVEMLLFVGLQQLNDKITNDYNQRPISLSVSQLFALRTENPHE